MPDSDAESPSPPTPPVPSFNVNVINSPETTSASSSNARQTAIFGFQLGKTETRLVAWSLLVLSFVNVIFGGLRLVGIGG